MTSKQEGIKKYFSPISLEDYTKVMAASARVTAPPPETVGSGKSGLQARILSINTNGTRKTERKTTFGSLQGAKVEALKETSKKLKLDAILTQELRAGSWTGQFPKGVRIFESNKMNVKHEGGRAAVIIINDRWEI